MLKSLRFWIQAALSTAVFVYLVRRLQAEAYPLTDFPIELLKIKIAPAALSLALLPLNQGLEALKWLLLVRPFYPFLSFQTALLAVLRGNALGLITPNRVGEYAGRALSLPSGRRLEATVVTAFDRAAQMVATCAMGVLGLCVLWAKRPVIQTFYLALFSAGFLILIIGLWFLKHKIPFLERLRSQYFTRSIEALRQIPKALLLQTLGLAFLRYFVFTAQYILLLYAFGFSLSIVYAFAMVAVVFLFKSVVPTLALTELGVREAIAVEVMGWLAVPTAIAFQATFLLFIFNLALPALVGAVLLAFFKSRSV